MDLSDYLKMRYNEMHRTTKLKPSNNINKQEKAEKRKTIRAQHLLARRNIDDDMSPYCTPLVEKKASQNAAPKRTPRVADTNRLKLLEEWKVKKAKEKQMEKAKQKPIFKVAHIESSLSINLENVNKMIKGQLIKKSQFAPENHKFRAPSGVKPIEFRCQSNLSKALSNASKPSNKFQKASYRSESVRNKNTVDGIGQKTLVKNTNSSGSNTNIVKTRSATIKPAEGSKSNKQPTRNAKMIDKPPGPSAYNTRANVRAKIESTSSSSLEQNKAKNTPKPAPIPIGKYVSGSNKPNKLESKTKKTSTVENSKSQTTPKTGLKNEPTTINREPNKAKTTPNFVAQNVKNSSADKHSKLGLNASKTCTNSSTVKNSKSQTAPKTGLKNEPTNTNREPNKAKTTPNFVAQNVKNSSANKRSKLGLNASKTCTSSSTVKNSKSQTTPKTGLKNEPTTTNRETNKAKSTTNFVVQNVKNSSANKRTRTSKVNTTPMTVLGIRSADTSKNKTPENIKDANTELLGAAYISPFVTVSRGKRSAREEFKARKSLNKNPITTTPDNPNTSAQAGAKYFMVKLDSEIVRINAKCSEWENYLLDPELPEEAQSSIGVTIGQSKLLVSKKFEQFRGLIKQCMTQNYEEKEITCEDLHGFWDMVYMQVENLDVRFENLHKLKDNNWSELLPETAEAAKKPKGPVKKTKVKKPELKTRTGIRDMIKAARAKQQKGDVQEENVFSGGYFEVRTPVKDTKNTPRSSTSKRRSRLSALTSEHTSSCKYSPSGLTLMKLSQSIKHNNGLTPSKSILKVSGRKSTGIKKVVFEDTISKKNIRKTILFSKNNIDNTNVDVDDGKISTNENDKENTPVRRSSRLLNRTHE
ncbi:unnamed protein product [Ceutorhynchus assimilis]|uniref:Disks large-associated protein 5 n=1 Tax=Ceutorhynchus assimilis TaxID=467358 RepID=A0A9N9MRU5_9CUCU|nr:unnamed protein product [Ceutorhynchus assimilis]